MKVIDVVGARPQFIKVAAVYSAIKKSKLNYILVNTDQHYDEKMSQVFFSELQIKRPDYSLGIGSGSHAEQTARMMVSLEKVFISERPDLVQVYGDTNSTIAAALVAAKLHIPVSHVEAGLRSFNRKMPEELNRVTVDHLSSLLFVPTKTALSQLKREGIKANNAHWVGDVMLDVVEDWKKSSTPRPRLVDVKYALATLHRAENTDDHKRLSSIIKGFEESGVRILLPIHPRLQKMLQKFGLKMPANVQIVEPLSHFEMLSALHHSNCVITDSGGLQKEAFYMGRFCVTLRDETEWKELVRAKVNVLSGADPKKINKLIRSAMKHGQVKHAGLYKEYGSGLASKRIVDRLSKYLGRGL